VRHSFVQLTLLFLLALLLSTETTRAEPLASWNDSAAKAAVLEFVARVTTESHPDFVPPAERIAVFDNDGTLWSEQPIYFQLAFALDRIRALAPEHPEWEDQPLFKAVLDGDLKALSAGGERAIVEIIKASHAGMTTDEFEATVRDWVATARHPRFDRPYTDLVYQPMLELLAFLRENSFKSFIVSGGGIEFMRPWVERVYGIPPEQVIGSSIKVMYEMRNDAPVLVRLPEVDFINDKAGKPVGIHKFIGRRPIVAFGNSDGDLEMLQWTTSGEGPRLGVIVRHTDGDREWSYDRQSSIGHLDVALDEADRRGWIVVDMKRDWRWVYTFDEQ
jgi:phosphoglycolate phosphatase-like HAD superfamily hydrolase